MLKAAKTCRSCNQDYVVDHHYDVYLYAPFHYGRDGSGYCLGCSRCTPFPAKDNI
jgi:hypothetical protein